jgi:hypothetical protein
MRKLKIIYTKHKFFTFTMKKKKKYQMKIALCYSNFIVYVII